MSLFTMCGSGTALSEQLLALGRSFIGASFVSVISGMSSLYVGEEAEGAPLAGYAILLRSVAVGTTAAELGTECDGGSTLELRS